MTMGRREKKSRAAARNAGWPGDGFLFVGIFSYFNLLGWSERVYR